MNSPIPLLRQDRLLTHHPLCLPTLALPVLLPGALLSSEDVKAAMESRTARKRPLPEDVERKEAF
jgi:hypothetical protein